MTLTTTRPRLGRAGSPLTYRVLPDRARLLAGAALVWAALWVAAAAVGGMYSWHYFDTAATVLRSPAAAHLYALHPELQIGPLAVVAAAVLTLPGAGIGLVVAAAVMLGLLVPLLWMLVRLSTCSRSLPDLAPRLFVLVVVLSPAWSVLAIHYGHLDDVLALVATAAAFLAVRRSRWTAAAVLLAAAAGFKPWAVPFAVALLTPSVPRRHLATYTALLVAPWVWFVLHDPRTLTAGGFTIPVAADSVLRALGVTAPATPAWDRPAQLLLATAAALVLARRGRPLAIPVAVLTVRMLLDPGTYLYYTTGLLVAALIFDLGTRPHRTIPVHAGAVTAWLALDALLQFAHLDPTAGVVRLTVLTALLIATLLPGRPHHDDPAGPPHRLQPPDRTRRLRPYPPRVQQVPIGSGNPAPAHTRTQTQTRTLPIAPGAS